MKKLVLICCVFLVVTQPAHTQTIDLTKTKTGQAHLDGYSEKYKTYKTAGWVFLGAGIGMIVVGGIGFASYAKQGFNGAAPVTAESFFLIIGPSAAIVSIPFFILAKRNKTKAELALKEESVTGGNKIFYQPSYTALALTLDF